MARSQPNSDTTAQRPLLQPDESLLTISYLPTAGQPVAENPPRFQWIPPQIGAHNYELELRRHTDDGDPGTAEIFTGIAFPFFTPPAAFATGEYSWRYRTCSPQNGQSAWSIARRFCVTEDSAVSPSVFDLDKVLAARPRLAIAPNQHQELRKDAAALPEWQHFVDTSVRKWMDVAPLPEPAAYPDDIRTAALWRESYIACQEMFYAIRNLAIFGTLSEDQAQIEAAKNWLLALASWDPDGPTSRSYNDEAAFRCVTALAWGYDWLHGHLTEAEREAVRHALLERGRQVARHVMHSSRIDTFPYDSHAVRAVSAVLIPVGLALAGEEREGDEWLQFAVNYLIGPFSGWGDRSGGWAEGMHYWTTAMCYALEAITVLRNAGGIDLYQRPFFRKTGNFPLYCRPAWTKRATFGDDSTLGDVPSPKIARNMRLLALATQTPEFEGYAEQILSSTTSDPMAFYNYGWWDFAFDDLLAAASFGRMTGKAGPEQPTMRIFPDVGWAALQARMDDPAAQIHCVFKSSPFGSISHSHADQNAFCLSAYGQDLLVQSGYYVAHNSTMHRNWRRQTLSKNALLIDGQGQYAGDDKLLARKSSGRLIGHGAAAGHQWVVGDATAAYQALTPQVTSVQRHMHMVFGATIIVVDVVTAAEPVPLTWLGHSYGDITLGELAATIHTPSADLGIEVIHSNAPVRAVQAVTGFDNVDPNDYAGLPASTRVEISLEPSRTHILATMLSPIKKGETPKVHCFVDDQGFGKILYCLNNDNAPVRIPLKAF